MPSESFEELAMPLFDSLYNFARWLTQDRDEAEDLVQETLLRAWRSFDQFQTGTNVKAWLFRILFNAFHAQGRKLRSRAGRKIYARRQGLIEPVFGVLKEQRGMRRFRRRGLIKVAVEIALATTAYNLTRIWNSAPDALGA